MTIEVLDTILPFSIDGFVKLLPNPPSHFVFVK